jgi:hypothetical protein
MRIDLQPSNRKHFVDPSDTGYPSSSRSPRAGSFPIRVANEGADNRAIILATEVFERFGFGRPAWAGLPLAALYSIPRQRLYPASAIFLSNL